MPLIDLIGTENANMKKILSSLIFAGFTALIGTSALADEALSPESQAILDEYTPRMAALVNAGMEMEPARNNDQGQCGDMMRQNQAELSALREDLSAAYKALPTGGAWHPNFEPLHNAVANLPRCVTCLPSALPDCREAADTLTILQRR